MKNGIGKKPNLSDIQHILTNELVGFLSISVLELPNPGLIGITPCPGRNHKDKLGGIWRRNLQQDLAQIVEWGADSVLTLLEGFGLFLIAQKSVFPGIRGFCASCQGF